MRRSPRKPITEFVDAKFETSHHEEIKGTTSLESEV